MRTAIESRLRKLEGASGEPQTDWSGLVDLANARLRVISCDEQDDLAQRAAFCELLPPIVADRTAFIASATSTIARLEDELRSRKQSDETARLRIAHQHLARDQDREADGSVSGALRSARIRYIALEAKPGGLERDALRRIERVRAAVEWASGLVLLLDAEGCPPGSVDTGVRRSPGEALR